MNTFNHSNRYNYTLVLNIPIVEHIQECYKRLLFIFNINLLFISISFTKIQELIKILEYPIYQEVKFFQISPDEYLISTLIIIIFSSIFLTIPFFIWQFFLFLLPGLKKKEVKIFILLLLISIILFLIGSIFFYYILIPKTLNFLLNYSKKIIEPIWSFNHYVKFFFTLFFNTSLIFQIPMFQILLELFNILSFRQTLKLWKYIIVLSTIFGAILTPSTDPFTQIIFTLILLFLYFFGLSVILIFRQILEEYSN